jgi:hypothetical protein
MTHSGVGPLTALACVLIIGTSARFQRGKQIGTYVGMIPCESPVLASNDLDTSASKATPCCGSCWWKQLKQRRAFTRIGDVGTFIWRCVEAKASPR